MDLKIYKMKYLIGYIIGYIIGITCLVGMIGCTDLEETPEGILAPEALFNKPSEVEAAVVSGYAIMSAERLFGRKFNCTLQFRGDMVDIGVLNTASRRIQVNTFFADANNAMFAYVWPLLYKIISGENAAIYGAELVETISEQQKNELVAEAKFIRAFTYYYLVRCFGDIPYIEEFVTDPTAVADISKTPVDQVYEKIIADLKFAKEYLPDQHAGNTKNRATKGTAAGVLASVYLTIENWQKAANESKWVIENSSRFNYALDPDYQSLFHYQKVTTSPEPMLTIDFSNPWNDGNNSNRDVMGPMTAILTGEGGRPIDRWFGYSVSVPNIRVWNTWDKRDYRKYVAFADTIIEFRDGTFKHYTQWTGRDSDRPHIGKWCRYVGNSDGRNVNTDLDMILFRYAEVLLIAAEALTELNGGPTAEAEGYINQIRARARAMDGTQTSAYPEDVTPGMSKDDFIDLVLEERRLELSFEWKRWFDIKRRKLGVEAFLGPNSLEPQPNFDPNRDYLFPIPAAELEQYPNLLPQNPGY